MGSGTIVNTLRKIWKRNSKRWYTLKSLIRFSEAFWNIHAFIINMLTERNISLVIFLYAIIFNPISF